MTEPNKELPKEESLNEKMYDAALDELTYDDFLGILGISSAVDKCHDLAQSHYAPIIETKDKQLSEKDKRIAELEAEVKKVMGLLKERYLYNYKMVSLTDFYAELDGVTTEQYLENKWADYCKENGIDLGGE